MLKFRKQKKGDKLINIKRLFCNHLWVKDRMIKNYYDYSGYKVGIFSCHCEKCKEEKIKKYY